MMLDMRRQFFEHLVGIGFIAGAGGGGRGGGRGGGGGRGTDPCFAAMGAPFNANATNLELVKAVLCAGLYPNVAVVDARGAAGPGGPRLLSRSGEVFLHPVSVLHASRTFESPYLIFHEKVKTTKVYVRDATAVSVYARARARALGRTAHVRCAGACGGLMHCVRARGRRGQLRAASVCGAVRRAPRVRGACHGRLVPLQGRAQGA